MTLKFSQLPALRLRGVAKDASALAKILKLVGHRDGRKFEHIDLVMGHTVSCRFISYERINGFTQTSQLVDKLTPEGMAENFFRPELLRNTRHGKPPEVDNWTKGWEVFTARVNGAIMIVLTATWARK